MSRPPPSFLYRCLRDSPPPPSIQGDPKSTYWHQIFPNWHLLWYFPLVICVVILSPSWQAGDIPGSLLPGLHMDSTPKSCRVTASFLNTYLCPSLFVMASVVGDSGLQTALGPHWVASRKTSLERFAPDGGAVPARPRRSVKALRVQASRLWVQVPVERPALAPPPRYRVKTKHPSPPSQMRDTGTSPETSPVRFSLSMPEQLVWFSALRRAGLIKIWAASGENWWPSSPRQLHT